MTLVPRESLLADIDDVYSGQKNEYHHLTSASPTSVVQAYYDAILLHDFTNSDEQLLMSMSIPYASNQTAFQINRAQVIPMQQSDSTEALRWVTEGPYLAILEDSMKNTVMTEERYSECLGTSPH